MTTPTTEGFYWARWLKSEPDTDDNGEACMGDEAAWGVVEVYENHLDADEDDYLRVFIPGIARTQSIDNFEWGAGPLIRPE